MRATRVVVRGIRTFYPMRSRPPVEGGDLDMPRRFRLKQSWSRALMEVMPKLEQRVCSSEGVIPLGA
jgi:hypothetical protein